MGGRLVRTLPFCKGFPEACLFFVENQSEAFFETSAHIRPWCVRLPRAVRCHADGWRLEMGGRLVERLPLCKGFPEGYVFLVENESWGFLESSLHLRHYHRR